MAVPKNNQRNWSSRERGSSRCKYSNGQDINQHHPIATVAGNSLNTKTTNAASIAPGAVRKEKSRNGACIFNYHSHQQHSATLGVSRPENHSENELTSNSSASPLNIVDQSNGSSLVFNQSLKNKSHTIGEEPRIEGELKCYNGTNQLSKNDTNGNKGFQRRTEMLSVLVKPLLQDETFENFNCATNVHDSLKSISTQNFAGLGEASQCEMAEADQASMCNSPDKAKGQTGPGSSSGEDNIPFEEVILTLPVDDKKQSKSSETSTYLKDEDIIDRRSQGPCVGSNNYELAQGIHSIPNSNDKPRNSLDLEELDCSEPQCSILNANLEKMQMEEESASALTVNAIVEEILNSPLNSGRNTPLTSDVETSYSNR